MIPLYESEKELLARFDDFFRAVEQVFAKIAIEGDIEALDFAIRGIYYIAAAAKAQLESMEAGEATTH